MDKDLELEYLRYFYDAVDNALGPASDDVYYYIAEDFTKKTGKELPVEYSKKYDEDEEN